MKTEDKIKELFAEKLGAHESPVNPELWNAIASKIGATSAVVASTGLSVVSKLIIGISAASIIGVGSYFIYKGNQNPQNTIENKNNQVVRTEEQKQILVSENEQKNKLETDQKSSSIANKSTVKNTELAQVKEENELLSNNSEIKERTDVDNVDHTALPIQDFFTNKPAPNLTGKEPINHNVSEKVDKEVKKESNVTSTSENPDVKPTDEIEVVENKATFEVTKMPNIYVLNANGYFSINYKGEYSDFQLTIMDRRNNVVFSSDKPNFEWRGTDMSGNLVEPGNYIYILTAKDKNGVGINKYSSLTVINQ